MLSRAIHLCGWHGPDLVVVRSHEKVRDSNADISQDPFIKILWLSVGHPCFYSGINHAIHALDLLFLWKHGNVVLEWIWYPKVLAADVRDSLMGVPVGLVGKCLVDAVIEVLVVGEDNMTADIVELRQC